MCHPRFKLAHACLLLFSTLPWVLPSFAEGISAPQLTLQPPSIPTSAGLPSIGGDPAGVTPPAPSSTPDLAIDWGALQSTLAPAPGESLLPDLDVLESERPWSTTTTVHLMNERDLHTFIPFVSIAREVDSLDIAQRFGLGGGTLFRIDPHASFSAEMLYLEDRLMQNPMFAPETRAFLRFQIDF